MVLVKHLHLTRILPDRVTEDEQGKLGDCEIPGDMSHRKSF